MNAGAQPPSTVLLVTSPGCCPAGLIPCHLTTVAPAHSLWTGGQTRRAADSRTVRESPGRGRDTTPEGPVPGGPSPRSAPRPRPRCAAAAVSARARPPCRGVPRTPKQRPRLPLLAVSCAVSGCRRPFVPRGKPHLVLAAGSPGPQGSQTRAAPETHDPTLTPRQGPRAVPDARPPPSAGEAPACPTLHLT